MKVTEDVQTVTVDAGADPAAHPQPRPAADTQPHVAPAPVVPVLVEDISIDGMCGVY